MTLTRKRNYAALAFVVFTASIAFCRQPGWITTKQDIRFPDEFYILGIGVASVGSNRSEAVKKSGNEAFADIAKQLRANITDVSATKTIEISTGEGASGISREMQANLRVSTDLKLAGLKVVDTYYDKGDRIIYSLAVLDRQLVGSEFKGKLKAFHEDYERYLGELTGGWRGVPILRRLSTLSGAYKSAGSYNSLLPVYNYVVAPLEETDSSWDMPTTIPTAILDQRAQDLFTGLAIDKVSGESQEVKLNEALKPLRVRISYEDSSGEVRPVAGVRIVFGFVNGSGKISQMSTTNDSGIAECQVYSLTPYASTFYSIRARADLSSFYAGAPNETSSWDEFLKGNPIQTTFSLVKTELTLDDKLRQLVNSLTNSLGDSGQTVCVSRIDYQGKIPGELSEYLRQHIESAIRQNSGLRLMMPPQVGTDVAARRGVAAAGSGDAGSPLLASAVSAGIRLVITGSYWQRSDGTELDVNAVNAATGAIVSSSGITIAGSILPNAALVPANYDSSRDDAIITNERSGNDISVNLWVNHADGIYHDGDTLSIFLSANKDVYVELVYVDASGRSLIIFPNTYEWNNRILTGRVYEIPDQNSVGILKVEPPFGREIIKVYASEKPFPIPGGTKFRGLVVLNSLQDFQTRTRGIGLVSKGYRENSVVISTFANRK